ncbi:aminotransferase class I/II-fold pyridoxal phosphate-dependent enzyme [Blautia marasmi]|uniref:aminotransferase class I/II-fold pyridoxal phosphate-dependent enzyme n=1 Tax=Blautia marasmi TaxID=1917868 RepID=UPI00266BFAB8|nr:aminotransferase class V-fold PLP-dependent enzyme [Blautia marasmi]
MGEEMWLDEALYEYSEKDYYPFHMPGHKREFCPEALKNPYKVDITEIDGFDNLHHAEGILLEAQRRAASLYGASESWYLVNGSTAGILSAVSACTSRGGEILMARNCHKAAYHAAYLRGLKTHYLFPQADRIVGLNGGISPKDVTDMLEMHSGIQAVLITSPTYDGVVSDVKKITEAAHAYHVPLIVDEAHGAHFPFSEAFPVSATACGADVVIHSLHKTLPSLTQTALLHRNSERVSADKLRRFLGIYQSSSPSYLFMAGMDACLRLMQGEGRELFDEYTVRLGCCRERLAGLKNLHLLEKGEITGLGFVYDLDESKMVVSTANTSIDGAKLHEILLERYHLQMEMAASQYVIALTSVMDTEEGFARLEKALLEIDKELEGARGPEARQCLKGSKESVSGEAEQCLKGSKESASGEARQCLKSSKESTSGEALQCLKSSKENVSGEARQCLKSSRESASGNAWQSLQIGRESTPGKADLYFENMRDYISGEACTPIAEAVEGVQEEIDLEGSEGRISSEYAYLYPPGIPFLVPGERISSHILDQLRVWKQQGLDIQGLSDYTLKKIHVLKR